MKLIPIRGSELNGCLYYKSDDGRFYAFKNPEWGWAVGRVMTDSNYHIEDVQTLNEARKFVALLAVES